MRIPKRSVGTMYQIKRTPAPNQTLSEYSNNNPKSTPNAKSEQSASGSMSALMPWRRTNRKACTKIPIHGFLVAAIVPFCTYPLKRTSSATLCIKNPRTTHAAYHKGYPSSMPSENPSQRKIRPIETTTSTTPRETPEKNECHPPV